MAVDFKEAFERKQSENLTLKLEKLKPYIDQSVENARQGIQQAVLSLLAPTLSRLTVVEKLVKEKFGISDDEMREFLWDHEDKAFGFSKSTEPTAPGDFLRMKLSQEQDGHLQEQVVFVNGLCGPRPQLIGNLEQQLLGLAVGEMRDLKPEGIEGEMKFTATILRVSKRPVSVLAAAPEATPEAAQ